LHDAPERRGCTGSAAATAHSAQKLIKKAIDVERASFPADVQQRHGFGKATTMDERQKLFYDLKRYRKMRDQGTDEAAIEAIEIMKRAPRRAREWVARSKSLT
jgi:hypothetical protein